MEILKYIFRNLFTFSVFKNAYYLNEVIDMYIVYKDVCFKGTSIKADLLNNKKYIASYNNLTDCGFCKYVRESGKSDKIINFLKGYRSNDDDEFLEGYWFKPGDVSSRLAFLEQILWIENIKLPNNG